MAATRVFLLRHAESAIPNVFHGAESDIELSDKGRKQAALIAAELKQHVPNAVVSSAMRRAHATGQAIAEACQAPHLVEPLLHERRVGSLSGVAFAGNDIWPETVRRWSAGETNWAHEGAESFDDIRARVVPVWQRVIDMHSGRTVVVVAHGIVCKVLLLTMFPQWTWTGLGSIRNVGLTELSHDGESWRSLRLNEWPRTIVELESESV